MSNPQLETTPIDIDAALEQGEALERLYNNPDFRLIILDGYLKDKVLNQVSLLAVPAIKQRGTRPDVFEDLIASSNLQFYFRQIASAHKGATEPPVLSDEEEAELAAAQEAGELN